MSEHDDAFVGGVAVLGIERHDSLIEAFSQGECVRQHRSTSGIVELRNLIVCSDSRVAPQRIDERREGYRCGLKSVNHEQRRLVGIVRIEKVNLRFAPHCGRPEHAHEARLCKARGALFQPIPSADWIARKLKPMTTKNDRAGSGSKLESRLAGGALVKKACIDKKPF
jgi:hypothetical protein